MKTVKEIYMYALGAIVIIGFFATFIFLILRGTYTSAVDLMVGAIITMATGVVFYFFGSSKGSADKTELMNK